MECCLTKKQWDLLMKILNTKPTDEQRKMMQEAIKNGKRIKTFE